MTHSHSIVQQNSVNLSDIRSAATEMCRERDALPSNDLFYPSKIWSEARQYLDFARELPDRHLDDIRLHTGLMTGVTWFNHMHAPYRNATDASKERIPLIRTYRDYTKDLPESFWCSEPITTPKLSAIGIPYRGRIITEDIVRYQRVITNLYCLGMIQYLEQQQKRPVIVEIGAGYGGMAYQLQRSIKRSYAYVIVDLPEILFWSATFLRVNHSEKSFFIYTPGNKESCDLNEACAKYDFLFMPNYRSQEIAKLKDVDLMVNLLSFQEMTDAQINFYVSLGAKYLYSENFTRHWINKQLAKPVHEIIANEYQLIPSVKSYGWLLRNANTSNSVLIWALFAFFGISKRHTNDLPQSSDIIWTLFGRMNIKRNKLILWDVIVRALRFLPAALCARIFGT